MTYRYIKTSHVDSLRKHNIPCIPNRDMDRLMSDHSLPGPRPKGWHSIPVWVDKAMSIFIANAGDDEMWSDMTIGEFVSRMAP